LANLGVIGMSVNEELLKSVLVDIVNMAGTTTSLLNVGWILTQMNAKRAHVNISMIAHARGRVCANHEHITKDNEVVKICQKLIKSRQNEGELYIVVIADSEEELLN
jgi:hypothetical protein